jgi:hypothetical protein
MCAAVGKLQERKDNQMDLHEVYVRNENGVSKVAEVRGTRADQVKLRREVRGKLNIGGERILLFTNGKLARVGIDKG